MSRRSAVVIAAGAALLLVGAVIVLTTAAGGPIAGRSGLGSSTTSSSSTTTTSTFPPPPAGLLSPPTPANDPALAALIHASCGRIPVAHTCYTPGQLYRAYDLGPVYRAGVTGRGITIGIVDSYGSPTIRRDLARFDQLFHLPAPPHFRIIQVAGKIPPLDPAKADVIGWRVEATLDVEWAHAIAPGASITLAETPVDETEGTTGFPQMVASELYMIRHHLADVISQSFAATEETFPSTASIRHLRSAILAAKKAGVTVLAASGDNGPTAPESNTKTMYPYRVVQWPASDPLVTAVGATHMDLGRTGVRLGPDSVWNDSSLAGGPVATGGGVSTVFSRPAFQDLVRSVVGSHRGIPDVSMLGASSSPAAIFASFPTPPGSSRGGIGGASGTSLATPQFAGIVALADQLAGRRLGWIDPTLYRLAAEHAPGLVPVVHGTTTVPLDRHATVPGFAATKGYNLATGLGTVDAADLVPELAGRALPTRT